jgi:hypothetical protein
MTIHIEIAISSFNKELLRVRIGDVVGSIDSCNTKSEAIELISDEIDSLLENEKDV